MGLGEFGRSLGAASTSSCKVDAVDAVDAGKQQSISRVPLALQVHGELFGSRFS